VIDHARDALRRASRIVALTGAGISAESGIPTFRGPGGLWRNFRPEQLATPSAFARDPKLVWEWYDWRRQLIAAAKPNPGHYALVALEQRSPHFTLITQNVDGLHDRAGSCRPLKLHGDIWRLRCVHCHAEWDNHQVPLPALPPQCQCGAIARPGVVWFGEALPAPVWQAAESAAAAAEILLVVGTSAIVYPAAALIPLARSAGAAMIEVNTDETPASSHATWALRGSSAEILPQLL
jgi:NAD-dependent deacetylase